MPIKNKDFLKGKLGRIYVARNINITVFVLHDGDVWFTNNNSILQVIRRCVNQNYWINSIDWAGSYPTYLIYGIAYDEENREFYPFAKPISPMSDEQKSHLKSIYVASMNGKTKFPLNFSEDMPYFEPGTSKEEINTFLNGTFTHRSRTDIINKSNVPKHEKK